MNKCCQFNCPCAKIESADLAQAVKRVGLLETSRMRRSDKRALSKRSALGTPKHLSRGKMGDSVILERLETALGGWRSDIGRRKREVSIPARLVEANSMPSTVSNMGRRSSSGFLA